MKIFLSQPPLVTTLFDCHHLLFELKGLLYPFGLFYLRVFFFLFRCSLSTQDKYSFRLPFLLQMSHLFYRYCKYTFPLKQHKSLFNLLIHRLQNTCNPRKASEINNRKRCIVW